MTAMALFSLRDALRWIAGGDQKEESIFESEKEAYEFCRSVYDSTGGATQELRRAYEFYLRNYDDSCEPFVGPKNDHDYTPPG
jgi:UDP-N-acetylmuramoylalanine-D-glutamate ligase